MFSRGCCSRRISYIFSDFLTNEKAVIIVDGGYNLSILCEISRGRHHNSIKRVIKTTDFEINCEIKEPSYEIVTDVYDLVINCL